MAASLYRDVVGSAAWDSLPRPIHQLHDCGGDGTLIVTSRGLARVASLLGFAPSPGTVPVSLRIERSEGAETWIRKFHDETFATAQRVVRGLIAERFGAFEVRFRVSARGNSLHFEMTAVRLFGLPLPSMLLPRMEAQERADGTRVHVSINVGKSFGYTGHIQPR